MTDVGQFAGRFHPLLVHFPIAFLVLAGLLEVVASRRGRDGTGAAWPGTAVTSLLVLAAASAVVAATAGYLLGTRGGYSGDTYDQHLTFGLSVAAAAVMTACAAWLRHRSPRPWVPLSRGLLVVTLVLLTRAGHLGATLTHGEGYLTEFAPAPLRALLDRGRSASRAAGRGNEAPVYSSIVQPMLREHCLACHGTAKAQGGLRLDTPAGIRKGGDKGAVIVPGHASASALVKRIWLPVGHEDAMPPKGRRPLSPADAALLRWWVDSGAPFEGTLAELEIPPDIMPALEASLGPIARGGPTIPLVTLDAPDAAVVAAIRGRGISVAPIAAGSPFLQVSCPRGSTGSDDERVASLDRVARHVLWLDVSGTTITDAAFATIARLPNLTRLNVSRTATTDAGLAKLAPLVHLEYLNLYATGVSDKGLARLTAFPKLRRLYVWQTAVTAAGAERVHAALPRLEIDRGEVAAP